MDHLDLALSHQQEAVYSNNDEGGNSMMSERVSSLAAGVYAEFENMIQKYGQEILENLMPMVVNLLEQLDAAYGESREQTLELEMLSEDNEQLITQYEREKQLRKLAESKYLEYEDAQDQEKRDLQVELEQYEHHHRQAESKIKSLQDHIERLEERLSEGKKDYSSLHTRHTEMIQSYMERMEQYRRMASSVHSLADASPTTKKNLHLGTEQGSALNVSSSHPNLSSQGLDTKLLQKGSNSFVSILPTMAESDKRNDLSFEDEANRPTGSTNTDKESKRPPEAKNLSDEFQTEVVETRAEDSQRVSTKIEKSIGMTTSTPLKAKRIDDEGHAHELDDKVSLPVMSYHEAEKSIISSTATTLEASTNVLLSPEAEAIMRTTPELLSAELQTVRSSEKKEQGNASMNAANSLNESYKALKINPGQISGSAVKFEEMMASQMSLDSTRLAKLHDDRAFSSVEPTMSDPQQDIERMNDLSLFAELSSQEPSFLGEVDSATGLSAVGREMETIIKENEELHSAKSKLQTQKNDLLQRVEEISREKELVEEQMNELVTMKGRLKVRITELEQDLKKTKHELEKAVIAVKNKSAEDRMSSANRKRFTRVEMARVLMERNQYKERLMELQEAVRWTEMIRASKENHLAALQQKKRSSLWKFFNNLFAGSSSPTPPQQRRPNSGQPINIWYGSGTAPSTNSHRRNNSVAGTASTPVEGITERQRQERKERYKHVKEHISTESRKQAYGWSLPANYSSDQEGPASVPVPVYCRPLNTDPAMKIWCCAGVSLEGGRKSDSTFLGLGQEFKEPSRSTVWIGTSTHSCSKITVLDANSPSTALDQFIVCSSHLLCMTAVPGLSEEDFDTNDGTEDQRVIKPMKQQVANLQKSRPPIGPRSYSYSSGAEMRSATAAFNGRKASSQETTFADTTDVSDVSGTLTGVQTEEESFPDDDIVDGASPKVTSALPTMWLGAQSGKIYIHSTISNWKKCLQSAKLKDSILSIVEIKGRVLVALADGTVAIFHRKPDGRWDLSNYHLLDLGRPHHSIRCMTVVHDTVWCGYRNKVQVINPKSMTVEKSFDAHPRRESQVRQLACLGDGVWVSIRLDSTLRLYNAKTYHHLQDIDIEPYVSKMLGTGRYGYSFVRITALLLSDDRLWVGTGNGVILSVPLVAARPTRGSSSTGSSPQGGSPVHALELRRVCSGFMPYCSMVHAQLSFHGHRDSVKFFVSVPGATANVSSAKAHSMAGARPPSPSAASGKKPMLVESSDRNILIMSGGEGYIDFRVGDDESDEGKGADEVSPMSSRIAAAERSHLLVWQISNK